MKRLLLGVIVLMMGAPAGRAQDMPLSQILIAGEHWVNVENQKPRPRPGVAYSAGGFTGWRWNTRPGEKAVYHGFPGDRLAPERFPIPLHEPAGLAFSPDGGTLFVADAGGTAVWAFRMANGQPQAGAPYAPLRLRRGAKTSQAAGLTVDRDGRIYVATPLGIQVFDPTGRLCGVMHAPAAGTPGDLSFLNDRLHVWVGESLYHRRLNTTGVMK